MMRHGKRSILVHANWAGAGGPKLMGTLTAERLRGKEVFSFTYADTWLREGHQHVLDPELSLYPGPHYPESERKQNFGLFLDSSPDRWGRVLMRRREAALARMEQRDERQLFESDFLLGVHDMQRMGGLRFSESHSGPFLNDNPDMACPPWASIRELEHASLMLEDDTRPDTHEHMRWLNLLLATGSSLGGARPKAGVVDGQGRLWIAKFPSVADGHDSGAWEMLAHRLATAAGIDMAESVVERFSSRHCTFLTRRFDRADDGQRIHFASAMTLLGHTDGHGHREGAGYLELAEFITSNGASPVADLQQLWKRIVFNVCVSNTDDHLRNHGFLLTDRGWRLSPAYDINPVETGTGLSLNISETDNALDLALVLQVAPHFRVPGPDAKAILGHVKTTVRGWEAMAAHIGIPRSEMQLRQRAFRLAFSD